MFRISVGIPTHNLATILHYALESICKQTVHPDWYEVLVVDNGSPDNTSEVVKSYQLKYPDHHLVYIHEPNCGASHARNRGWKEASSPYVIYTDDDCKLPEHWVEQALFIIDRHAPDIFGGPCLVFYDTSKPSWFKDIYCSDGTHLQEGKLPEHETLYAPSLGVKRDILAFSGGYDTSYGPIGGTAGFGDEMELLIRIRQMRPETFVFYDPNFFAYHLVRPEKMQWSSIIKFQFLRGQSLDRLYPAKVSCLRAYLKFMYYIGKIMLESGYGLIFRNRKDYPYFQNYLYEQVIKNVQSLAQTYEQMKRCRKRL